MDLNRTWGRMDAFEALAGGEPLDDFDPSEAVDEDPAQQLGTDAFPVDQRAPTVRGLDVLREEPEEAGLRRWVATLLGASVLSAAAVTLGVAFGEDAKDAVAEADPLAAFEDLGAPVKASQDGPAAAEASGRRGEPKVDPADLSFPDALLDGPRTTADVALAPLGETRPEVAVTMAAAAAELEALEAEGLEPAAPRPLPAAAIVSGEAAHLGRVADRDPLVAGALPGLAAGEEPAPEGRPGRYVLHVASYESPDEAEVFAEALRSRGHAAFVRRADLPERGPRWRVQIGPFERLGKARRYAARFEAEESLHPVVVRERQER